MAHGRSWNGWDSTKARARWAGMLPLPCTRCGAPVEPGTPFDVDHLVPLSQGGGKGFDNQGPAHRSCNRRHGARLRNGRNRGGSVPWDVA
jgi:5-methylcytosine-specific restriction endonuclease McrA